MEGPTPVSALIHAATMVAAGVFLIARVFPLMAADQALATAPLHALSVVAVIGAITALLGRMIAVAQNDIKRVLAFSTVSQLGYMMLALGVGSWVAAIFHLMTHAFFKALLFLGAGSVIDAAHHEQDIRRLGGLRGR
jgi:NADH-quinone oxidoreductase subunit L